MKNSSNGDTGIILSWWYNPDDCAGSPDDSLVLFFYNFTKCDGYCMTNQALRADLSTEIFFQDSNRGDEIAGWGFFVSADGKFVSRTKFFGVFIVGGDED